jgi:signal transduction histidine kinase
MFRDSLHTPSRWFTRLFFIRGVAALICLAAVATLCGWAFAMPALRSLLPGAVQMKVNTALALLLSGIALYFVVSRPTPFTERAAALLACVVAGIGAASLAEYLFGWRLGIDELFVRDTADAFNAVPGRMSPMSAVAFIALAIALGSMTRRSLRGVTIAASAAVLSIGSVSLLGYLWRAGDVITDRWLPPVALNSALCFQLLAAAILLSPHAKSTSPGATGPELKRVEIRVLAGFLAALAFLIFSGGYTYTTSVAFADSVAWISHTQEVRVALAELSGAMANAELAQRDFLLTADQKRKETFEGLIRISSERLEALESLLADNAAQRANLTILRSDVNQRVAVMDGAITAFEHFGVAAARAVVAVARRNDTVSTEVIRSQAERMDAVEARLLSERQATSERKRVVTFISLVCTLALASMLFMGLFRSIRVEMTTRENLAEELQSKAKLLQESNKELESFSYSVSHDLRAPLRAIDGFALMLEEDYAERLDAEGRRFLTVIRDNTNRMGFLVDDLLAFSRLGRQSVAKSELNMDGLVREVMDEALRDHKGRVPEICIENLPTARADLGLLRQVWTNLISNAIKYSSKSPQPMVTVSGQRSASGSTYVVKDNGVGFSMAYAEKLFGVFQRLHRADEFEGTGVGLAIVHRIISRHGGRVWADGKVNEGATFSFTLPSGDTHG